MNGESRDPKDGGPGGLSAAPAPGFGFPAPEGHGHAVRFYEDEPSLAGAVAAFLAPGLAAGEAALVFASPGLRESLMEALPGHGIDARAATEAGRLRFQDARGTLDRILSPDGLPDEDLFMRVIGGMLAKASAGRPALRAFSGMSALPWAEAHPEAALALERLWGLLCRTVAFSLLCAYPLRAFRGDRDRFARVCDAHGSVIPCEPFRTGAPEEERMRQVAELQLRLAELGGSGADDAEWKGVPGSSEQGLADAAPALIWAAGPDGRLAYVNRTWLEFTGNDEARELERGSEGIHPADRQAAESAYARALEARAPFRTEFRYRRRDGAWRWLLNTGSPRLGADGSFLGFVGAAVDVTESKAAEEQARQAKNLEAVGRLAGGLAHDFNNLLTAINGYSEIGLSLAPEEGPLRDFLSEIRRAGERASALTRRLLAYGRKQILAATVFDPDGTLDDMDAALRRMLGNEIRLVRIRQAGLGRIRSDPSQLQQILMDLVLNARDAMPKGGTLVLETADVMPAPGPDRGPGPYVMLAVGDSGPGMPPEVLARVFEPFFTTKEAGAGAEGRMGAGLGLASVYGVVRQSGGYITVESEAGRGTVFRAYFPWMEPEDPAGPGSAAPSAQSAGATAPATVLIAAQDPQVRRFLARAAAGEGFAALEAGDASAAEAMGQDATRLDLLIVEDPFSGLRASSLLARLRARHPALRSLFLPSAPEAADLPGPPGAEGAFVLERPFTRADFAAALRQASAADGSGPRPDGDRRETEPAPG